MKNLNEVYKEALAYGGMTWEQYLNVLGDVLKDQKLFTLTSCEQDTGLVMRSDDGSYHVWFVGKTTSPRYEGFHFHVTQTGIWPADQLSQAMNGLMSQMQIDCEGLIERNGVPYKG